MRTCFRFTFLSVFLFAVILLRAQNLVKIDSLQRLLLEKTGVEQFDLLNAIGFEYRLSFPDSTIYYCTKAYALGQSLQLTKDLSRPLSFIGLANAYKGDYKESFEFHTNAIEVAQEQQDSLQLAYSFNNYGRLFFDQGDMTRAYNQLLLSQAIFEKLNDPTGLAYVYRSLANLHKSQRDFEKALSMALKAFELRKRIGESRGLLSASMELGSIYSALDNTELANHYFKHADSIATGIHDEISLAEIRIGWADFLISHNDTVLSHDLAHRAFSMVEESANLRLLPRASLLMGHVHYKLNEFPEAKEFLERVLEITTDSNLDLKRDAYLYLSKIYEAEGRTSAATFAFNKYLVLKESLQSIELARQIEKLQFQLDIEKIERENEILKANDANNDAIIRQQQLEKIILIVVITFISMLFIMQVRNSRKRKNSNVTLFRQNFEIDLQRKEIKEQNEKLEKRNQELSDLNNEKDTLMNIVAHDLKSPLNRIKAIVELIEMDGNINPNQAKYLGLLKDSTRAGLDLIVDLLDVNALEVNREPNITYFNLTALVNARVSAFQPNAASKAITLTSDCTFQDLVYLDQNYIGRILDNLISNAIKFSPENSSVTVITSKRQNLCSIQIKDDGPGFVQEDLKYLFQKFKKLSARPTAGESSNGLGLAIVKILVERLGGKVELQTEPRKGSTFEILFPVTNTIQV